MKKTGITHWDLCLIFEPGTFSISYTASLDKVIGEMFVEERKTRDVEAGRNRSTTRSHCLNFLWDPPHCCQQLLQFPMPKFPQLHEHARISYDLVILLVLCPNITTLCLHLSHFALKACTIPLRSSSKANSWITLSPSELTATSPWHTNLTL